MVYLRDDRFDPENLEAMEARRWACALRYKYLIRGPWKRLFEMIPKDGFCYGFHKGIKVCFHYSDGGLSHTRLNDEGRLDPNKFVRCLPFEELALHINSPMQLVREGVAHRLKGTPGYDAIECIQDVVDLHYRLEDKIHLLLKAIKLYDEIVLYSFKTLNNRVVRPSNSASAKISLVLNGRVYVYKEGKFLISPEMQNWVFFPKDVTTKEIHWTKCSDGPQLTAHMLGGTDET